MTSVLVPADQPRHLSIGLLFILGPGVEDPDMFQVVPEVYGLGVFDQYDLSCGPEVLLIDLPYHVPLTLICGWGRVSLEPENTHLIPFKGCLFIPEVIKQPNVPKNQVIG